jgi:hypothetical protein
LYRDFGLPGSGLFVPTAWTYVKPNKNMKKETLYLILSISVGMIALSFIYSKIYLEPKYKNIELTQQQEKADFELSRYIKECEEAVVKKYDPEIKKALSLAGENKSKDFEVLIEFWTKQIELEQSECKSDTQLLP